MPDDDSFRREMRCGVTQQKQRVEICARQLYACIADQKLLAGLCDKMLQCPFDPTVRSVGVYIQKIVVVFYHHPFDRESRMVVLARVYSDVPCRLQGGVSLLLASVEPYIDVSARTVLRYGVAASQSVTFEQHCRDTEVSVKFRKADDSTSLTFMAAFKFFDMETPSYAQFARRSVFRSEPSGLLRFPDAVPYNPCYALSYGKLVKDLPSGCGKTGEAAVIRAFPSRGRAQ